MTKWRLGLDGGTNSIGWAAIRLDENGKPSGLLDAGVRIFSDGRNPKDGQSLAVQRRLPRSMRRNRDRYLLRRSRFMDRLIEFGLMPQEKSERKELEALDPWELRVRGLDQKLSPYELGRALFHLQQRRGFKSNRKTDKGTDDESGKIKSAANEVRLAMEKVGARTLGELLAAERVKDPKNSHKHPVRARLHGSGAKAFYDFYPTREMIEEEFDALWNAQLRHHRDALTVAARAALHKELFFQRPLRKQPVGKCTFIPAEERAPRALPTMQRLRIYQEVNHLTVRLPGAPARKLSLAERDLLVQALLGSPAVTFDRMRRVLKLPEGARFNFESEKRKGFDGDQTAALLAKTSKKEPGLWGPSWRELDLKTQDSIVERLLEEEDEVALVSWLMEAHGHSKETALAISNAPLPDGHAALGRTAGSKILASLASSQTEAVNPQTGEIYTAPFTYDQAVKISGFEDHSFFGSGDAHARLPYYGEVLERHVAFGSGEPSDPKEKRFGKIANPTVHVVMNQIRRVVNKLIQVYGPPHEIAVELARELPLSAEGKRKLEREQKENQDANEARRKLLAEQKQQDNYENRLRLRLWEELNRDDPTSRRCPYTGEQISIEKLFSPEIEIEHILPFSKTLDDGIGNKTLCTRKANRDKAQRCPYDAFGHSPAGYTWDDILARANELPSNKAWRFGPDAMQRFEDEERDFLARQLNDTKYAARLMRQYLTHAIPSDDPQERLNRVWVTPGRLTSDLRHVWGLNSVLLGHNVEESADPKKNRNDHRHHAIDAVVIGLTDRGLLQRVATNAARAEQNFDSRLLAGLKEPWPDFRDTVRDAMERLIVSHKPDHGREGALHEDTNYGVVQDPLGNGERLVSRKPLTSLTAKEVTQIGDLKIRADLIGITKGLDKKALQEALAQYGKEHGIRRVRIHKVEGGYKTIHHGEEHMRAVIPGENYCVDIVEMPDGAWKGFGISVFDINQPGFVPDWQRDCPAAIHVMRVHKNDLIKLEKNGAEVVTKAVRLSPSNDIFYLVDHNEAGDFSARHKDEKDGFRWDFANFGKLKSRRARLVHVDEIGRVYDPVPPK